jgi:hypothetical protein
MKRVSQWVLVTAVIALAIPVVWGQQGRGRGFGGGFGMSLTFLAGQKSVQEELKMTEEQTGKIKELGDKQNEARTKFREETKDLSKEDRQKKFEEYMAKAPERTKAEEKAVSDVLKPEQLKRLKQISLQQQGSRAVATPEVADALKLTSEQKDKIKTIQEDSVKEMRDLFGGGGGNREEARKKMEELRKATSEKVMGVLTDEQKAKYKELTGEPFKGEIARPGFGGGRGERRKKD